MDKKQIIIGTTSINRPELHNDNIQEWYNWINNLDKNLYVINWFINIDWIEKLGSSVQETKENYKTIIKDINLFFLESETGKGNFLQACKRISDNIEKFVEKNNFDNENVIIIWLEDDWKLSSFNIPLQILIENYLSNLTVINLSFVRLNYIHALAPSIISYELWSKLHLKAWKRQTEHIDPEHCVGIYFIKNFSRYEHINNLTVINKKIDEKFLNQEFMNLEKSFYTYHMIHNSNIINERYIEKKDIKAFCKDKITFMRITPSFCIDGCNYGRKFMDKLNITKKKKQDNDDIDFYTIN